MELIDKLKEMLNKEIRSRGFPVRLIYLYGSYSKGRSTPKSDIDLAVLFDEDFYKKKTLEAIGIMEVIALRLEKALHKKIDIKALNRASLFFSYIVVTTGMPVFYLSKEELYKYYCKILGMYFDFRPFMEKTLSSAGRNVRV
ncbi:MAG: nucleotidyltransferase domain-containing protein [Thermodesulfovibrionales bacterium]|nr:nucleotidyltransferase domain-containing protein [Thermodesulfovibrionales bacterium]